MDKRIEKNELKAEKEKLKQHIEEKQQPSAGTSKNESVSEEKKKDDIKDVIKSSSSASSYNVCSARSRSSSDFYPPPKSNARKRKAGRGERARSAKRVKKTQKRCKSRNENRKNANKRRNDYSKQRKVRAIRKQRKLYNKRTDGDSSEKSHDGCTSHEDDSNKEYNKKLDVLAKYGGNFYCPSIKQRKGLRPIYIDGSNVAYSHGQHERFSVEGLKICIDYFRKRGHKVKAFVPNFRLRKGETSDQNLLHSLVKRKLVITTPTLYIQNQRRSPYDDWYIVQSAAANGGIIVSADNFEDIVKWNSNLRSVIEECRLVPTFVDDMLIFPVDPHGNRLNNLENFLRF